MEKQMKDRFVELLNHQFGKQVSEIVADWLLANGAIAPYCSVGDTAYWLTDRGAIRELTVTNIHIELSKSNAGIWYDAVFDLGGDGTPCYIQIIPEKIGEQYFFSREAAEKAAKERKVALSDKIADAEERSAATGGRDGKVMSEHVKE